MSAGSPHLSPEYGTRVLKVFTKLFSLAEKHPSDTSYKLLCSTLGRLAAIDTVQLQAWLSKMIMPLQSLEQSLDDCKLPENR